MDLTTHPPAAHAMRVVMVESPYMGKDGNVELNVFYALHCMRDSCERGEAPILSHLLYTRLPDGAHAADDAEHKLMHREQGLQRALAIRNMCKHTVLYVDEGVSAGMERAAQEANAPGHSVEYRMLPHWAELKHEWMRGLEEC